MYVYIYIYMCCTQNLDAGVTLGAFSNFQQLFPCILKIIVEFSSLGAYQASHEPFPTPHASLNPDLAMQFLRFRCLLDLHWAFSKLHASLCSCSGEASLQIDQAVTYHMMRGYAHYITAVAGTRLAFQSILTKGFEFYSFPVHDMDALYCYCLSLPSCVRIGCWNFPVA